MSIHARFFLLAAITLAWPTAARANIGDDISQLRGRYGAAKQFANQMLFHVRITDDGVAAMPPSADQHEGYSLAVYFDGAHSAMEIFTRNTSDPEKMEISKQDIDHILASEGEGSSWNPVQVRSGKPTWIRADQKLIARFSSNASGESDEASVLVIMLNAK